MIRPALRARSWPGCRSGDCSWRWRSCSWGPGLWRTFLSEAPPAPIAYSQFYALLTDGKVQSVVMSGEALDATLKSPETVAGRTLQTVHTTAAPNDPALLPLLRQKGVQIDVNSQQQSFPVQLMLSLLPWALIIGFWVWMSRRAKTMLGSGNPFGGMPKNQSRKFDKTTSVNVTFEDIAGLKAAKRDLQEVVQFLKEPDRFQRLGGKVPRGVLLIGPPGTGKTLLARAVAGESGVAVLLHQRLGVHRDVRGAGRGARPRSVPRRQEERARHRVHRRDRRRRPGAGRRSRRGNDEREQTLNQLLSEMDGFERSDLVVVIAATNRPDVLDPALLRPGRFDRRVLVDRPELAARQAILDVHAKGKPLALDVNLQVVAQNTPGFSGADLANLVNEAALSATREGRESITAADFTEAFDKIVLGDPREAKLDAKEKRRVAIHEAGHAVVAAFSPDDRAAASGEHHPARHGAGGDAAEPGRRQTRHGARPSWKRACACSWAATRPSGWCWRASRRAPRTISRRRRGWRRAWWPTSA